MDVQQSETKRVIMKTVYSVNLLMARTAVNSQLDFGAKESERTREREREKTSTINKGKLFVLI